jgi:hypothetical protein
MKPAVCDEVGTNWPFLAAWIRDLSGIVPAAWWRWALRSPSLACCALRKSANFDHSFAQYDTPVKKEGFGGLANSRLSSLRPSKLLFGQGFARKGSAGPEIGHRTTHFSRKDGIKVALCS